jgi:hypothetical protein
MPVRIDCKTSHVATRQSMTNEPHGGSSEAPLLSASDEKISQDSGSVASLASSSRLPSAALQSRPGEEDGASTFQSGAGPLDRCGNCGQVHAAHDWRRGVGYVCPGTCIGFRNAWGSSRSGAV